MEPVKIIGIVLVRGWERELPVAMYVDDIFNAGSRFSEREISILYNGGLAKWI
jgi:hypothetical protein